MGGVAAPMGARKPQRIERNPAAKAAADGPVAAARLPPDWRLTAAEIVSIVARWRGATVP
jgi:hypothetical protein